MQINYYKIPKELITDFEKNIDNSIKLKTFEYTDDFSCFNGDPPDIFIYIEQHLTELIVGSVVFSAIYDSLKYSLKTLWKRLVSYYKKNSVNIDENQNKIELIIEIKPDKTISFNLKGDIDENLIDKLTEEAFNYLKDSQKQEKDFNNQDYQPKNTDSQKINMVFDPETNSWEPYNYSTYNKNFDEAIRKAIDESEN